MKVTLGNLGKFGVIKDIDAQEIAPEYFTEAQNIRFTEEGVKSVRGDRRAMATGLTRAKWLMQVPPNDRPLWVYGDETILAVYDGIAHSGITRVAQAYSGNSLQRWNGGLFSGMLVLNNTVDKPQLWSNFDTSTPMVDLPNWPDALRCKFLRPFKSFLIAGNLTEGASEYPFRLRWSHPAAPGAVPQSWATDNPAFDSRQVDLGETKHELVDSLDMGDINVVYREKSAWGMQFIGGQSKFRLWPILDNDGLLWRDCVQKVPQGHLAWGQNDIYGHNGQKNSTVSIVNGKTRKWLFSLISPENFRNCFTLLHEQEKEVWFCLPEIGSEYATFAMIYNYDKGGIGFRDLPGVPFGTSGVLSTQETTSNTWGN
jgi:hypothetical protein